MPIEQWRTGDRSHRFLSVADDELARPVSLQLRSHLIDESDGDFRLTAVVASERQ